jgi:hypothetical protein
MGNVEDLNKMHNEMHHETSDQIKKNEVVEANGM